MVVHFRHEAVHKLLNTVLSELDERWDETQACIVCTAKAVYKTNEAGGVMG